MLIASTSISGLPRQLWPGEAEQAVLDFVPSAGPAREVADDDLQPDSICELRSSTFHSRPRALLDPPKVRGDRQLAASG
jgi:hypothetical protein